MRHDISLATQHREHLREKGKVRKVIQSTLHLEDQFYDMSTLVVDNATITDPEVIHQHLTHALQEHFAIPPSIQDLPIEQIRHLLHLDIDQLVKQLVHSLNPLSKLSHQ